jgi:hypothetical protein
MEATIWSQISPLPALIVPGLAEIHCVERSVVALEEDSTEQTPLLDLTDMSSRGESYLKLVVVMENESAMRIAWAATAHAL